MISFLQKTMIGVSPEKNNIWLHYSVLSIIIIIFGVPPEAKALPHAIRIGAIFTGKPRSYVFTNYTHYWESLSKREIEKKGVKKERTVRK